MDGASLGLGIVVGAEDKNFTPIAIEDTDILDRMYEEFTIFFRAAISPRNPSNITLFWKVNRVCLSITCLYLS